MTTMNVYSSNLFPSNITNITTLVVIDNSLGLS